MPRVSVCSSVLNQSEWLKDMIQSVINQTFTDWELILVDDGSTEDIKAVVDSFNDERIKLHRFPENRGIPHGVNWAMEHATGEFVQPLAADETIWERKLEWQVAYLDANPGVSCVCGLPRNGPMGERPEWEMYALRAHNRSRESWIRTFVHLENIPVGGCSILFRRKVFDDIGYFSPDLTIFSDHEWYLRLIEKYVFRMVPVRFANYREDSNSVSSKDSSKAEEVARQLKYVHEHHPVMTPQVFGKVTCGIPMFNMGWCVKDAIDSIRNQTYKDWELFICDDKSEDDSLQIVRQYVTELNDPRIKVMAFDENRGQMEALNQMAFRASGTFFMPLSADDVVSPNFMEKCIAEFGKHPWTEFVSTQTDFMDKDGKTWTDANHPFLSIPKPINMTRDEWLMILRQSNLYFGQGMYRTVAISEVGGWSKTCGVLNDYEMYLKLLQRENIRIIEEPLTHTRIHNNQSLLTPDQAHELKRLYFEAKAPYFAPRQKVVIATPFYEIKGYSPYIESIVDTTKMLSAAGIEWEFMAISGDSYVHRVRNTICARVLEDPSITDLFFIDSDMSWDAPSFLAMVLLPHEIIGGTYHTKGAWDQWTSVPTQYKDTDTGSITFMGHKLSDGSALLEADVLAGGFMRIKRSLLLKYKEHYKDMTYKEPCADFINRYRDYTQFFHSGPDTDKLFYGEDHWFSKRLREMGEKMWIYPNATISHWGIKGYDGNYDRWLKARSALQPLGPVQQ